jgi:hypothetical protein
MLASYSASTSCHSEHVGIEPIVVPELKLRDAERHVFDTFVKRAERSDDSVFNAEYRPNRTHLVTTGLDPVVHGDIQHMRPHRETDRAGVSQ